MAKSVSSLPQESKGKELISIIAHQLRTPLTTLRWFLEPLLEGEAGSLTDKQRQFLLTFFQSTEAMNDLVDNILNALRIEGGSIRPSAEEIDLEVFTKQLFEEARLLTEKKSQRFARECAAESEQLQSDPHLLHEALSNLIHNAIQYTPDGGKIDFKTAVNADEVIFSVKDSGCGIPKEEQGRIFEKSFRASNVISKVASGTGLGLYVAKLFVTMLGGKIWFESEENKGTAFYVSIPTGKQRNREI